MPKNLGVWRGWKLGECFSGDMETSGWLFARVGTWHSCTLETFGVQSWYSGTSVAFVVYEELGARSVVVSCRSVVVCGCSVAVGVVWWWCFFRLFPPFQPFLPFPHFGKLGGFCGVIGTSVFAFVYIFRSVGGVLSAWEHRAVGGSSDGGVKGIPLNNPLFG